MIRGTASLESLIKAQAYGLGFDLVGITRLGPTATAGRFERWLEAGMAGSMNYLERGRARRRDTRLPFPPARSAIVVAMNYGGTQRPGPIARYARGRDYHRVLEKKLRRLLLWLREATQLQVAGKAYVDTGPLLERDLARKAGLGWFGKNTNLINPQLGSFFFLAALLVELELAPDSPFEREHCGSCRRCIDACPTTAIVDDGVLDANRCISYLTIENRADIPAALRAPMGELIYGCDICQEVCPWNERFSRDAREPALAPRHGMMEPNLGELLSASEGEFATAFRGSPITRARRGGFARNVAVAMGNRGDPLALPALIQALRGDDDPLVRRHCAWAIGRFRSTLARAALHEALDSEKDATVLEEIRAALGEW